jgi:hypothetical protein
LLSRLETTLRCSSVVTSATERRRVKLEGAGRIRERHVGMVGIRDRYPIAHVDDVIAGARDNVPAA